MFGQGNNGIKLGGDSESFPQRLANRCGKLEFSIISLNLAQTANPQ